MLLTLMLAQHPEELEPPTHAVGNIHPEVTEPEAHFEVQPDDPDDDGSHDELPAAKGSPPRTRSGRVVQPSTRYSSNEYGFLTNRENPIASRKL